MPILLDEQEVHPASADAQTLGNAMAWVQDRLRDSGKVVVRVEVAGRLLDGPALDANHSLPLAGSQVAFSTASKVKLTHTMLGKLAALVDFLNQQHPHIAGLLEKGETAKAMELLGSALSAWNQIQSGFSGLLRLLGVSLEDLPVGERSATDILTAFRDQLREIHAAVESRDLVLLADILQYEMERTAADWKSLLIATLGVVGTEGIDK